MADWAVGDLAVRVDCSCGGGHTGEQRLPLGTVYRVIGVRVPKIAFRSCLAPCALILAEDSGPNQHLGFCSVGFRKIRPDEHTECEPEFVQLLQRSKKRVSA